MQEPYDDADAALIANGREAWEVIKASRAIQRKEWHSLGCALRLGQRSQATQAGFNDWCAANGFQDVNADAREGAMQFAKSSTSVGVRVPLGVRAWYWDRDVKPARKPRREKPVERCAAPAADDGQPLLACVPDLSQIAQLMRAVATGLQRSAELIVEAAKELEQADMASKDADALIDPLIKALETMRR